MRYDTIQWPVPSSEDWRMVPSNGLTPAVREQDNRNQWHGPRSKRAVHVPSHGFTLGVRAQYNVITRLDLAVRVNKNTITKLDPDSKSAGRYQPIAGPGSSECNTVPSPGLIPAASVQNSTILLFDPALMNAVRYYPIV